MNLHADAVQQLLWTLYSAAALHRRKPTAVWPWAKLLTHQIRTTSAPKGLRDSFAILKNCLPNTR